MRIPSALFLLSALIAGWESSNVAGQPFSPATERVYFSALTKEEMPALGLKASDFELRINGKPTPLEDFRSGSPTSDRSVPLAAIILISFHERVDSKTIERQAGAAANLFHMLHPASVIGVKLVSDRSEPLALLAHDPSALRNAFVQYGERRSELNVGIKTDGQVVGKAGMARALELAVDEVNQYVESQPSFRGQEMHRAIMFIIPADRYPSYSWKDLYAKAARSDVFVYPVYYPVQISLGDWDPFFILMDYFQMAQKTAGVSSVFGSPKPGTQPSEGLYNSLGANSSLTANFLHMISDINGKYSFTVAHPEGSSEIHLELKCKSKGIQIRMPNNILP